MRMRRGFLISGGGGAMVRGCGHEWVVATRGGGVTRLLGASGASSSLLPRKRITSRNGWLLRVPTWVCVVSDHTECGAHFTPQCFARGVNRGYITGPSLISRSTSSQSTAEEASAPWFYNPILHCAEGYCIYTLELRAAAYVALCSCSFIGTPVVLAIT